ncbi:MAG: chromosome segregation protein SMC [Anaerolineales bacterium]|nr:chromosome segregation protein SMC [Anaerolineales bacterium]
MPLRLKSLELHGYKTFASRTLFEFADGITAIVGPNGSGKSNIADALRWVLGEQSYGLLRAKRTEDMIFAGSEGRTRAGMASASILFDNNDNWLPVDFSEVSMGRRAYRDGRNDYVLNNQHVRLRDINELLAQSGLSERTYTILGQGLVDASLALKADERRKLFEEAAGVGLYRSRREETLRRLETTQRNLERVLDIMAELEPRLRTLDRQSRRAREYSRMQEDLHVLLRDWYGYHWHKTQKELAESREILRQQEVRQREAREGYQSIQADYSTFRERLQGLRAQLNTWHRESSELHSQREAVSRELAVLDERQRSLTASRQTLSADHDRAVDEGTLARERLSETESEVARVEAEFEEANGRLKSAQEALGMRQAERTGVEEKLRAAQALITSLHSRRAETQARLDELGLRRAAQAERMEAAKSAIQEADNEVVRAEGEHHSAELALKKAEKALHEAEADLEKRVGEVARLEEEKRRKNEELAALKADQSRLVAQFEVLEQAEQSLQGYAEGARFLMEAARQSGLGGARGALSAALDVPAELETAIAAALGEHLDAVLLEGEKLEDALTLLESDQAGRAALLPLDGLAKVAPLKASADGDCLGVAAGLIDAPAEFRVAIDLLLGQVLVVRDRAAARRLIAGQPGHVRAVTLRGEVFRADGLVLAGKSSSLSTLSRPRQRRELGESLTSLGGRLESLEAALQNLNSNLLAAGEASSAAEATLREVRANFASAQSKEREAAVELDSAKRQLEWQKKQLEALQVEASRAEAEWTELNESQGQIESESAGAQEEVRILNGQISGMSLDEAQEQVSYWTTRAAVAGQSLEDVRARRDEREAALTRLEGQQKDYADRLEEIEAGLAQLERDRESLHEREGALNEQIAAMRAKIDPAEGDLATTERLERELQEKEDNAQRGMTSADRLYNQVQVDVIRRQEALDSLRNRIQDDFGLVMFEYENDVSGPMPLPLDGMVEQLPVVNEISPELEEQMKRQRAQLRRMGPINPEAQKEFESESERYEFMKTQVEDLRKAEADLRQVIAELDELTKQEFSKTFEAVDKEFRQIFVRLFGGGSARLGLTDPENLVDTGIEIEARLPGRREQGLALLSGGERSLTAIALVFALLRVSPTPVCVMDEVDAMLDEANVARFRDLLEELSQDTQFIIITHNRNTVQAADVIYGVTMGRDSASQVISLKLDEVTDEFIGRT